LSLITPALLIESWSDFWIIVTVFICSEVILTFIFSLRYFFVSFEEAEEKGKSGMRTLHKITLFAAAIVLILPVLEDYGVISDTDDNLLAMLPILMAIHVIFSIIDGYKKYWQKKAGDKNKPEK
jgi:phosphatidylglycerophosphate synthase